VCIWAYGQCVKKTKPVTNTAVNVIKKHSLTMQYDKCYTFSAWVHEVLLNDQE